jgi:peptide/nickel transport system substrate-binding protein
MRRILSACFFLLLTAGAAQAAGTLRIGLAEDPDALDPATAGSYVGRIVFAALCDKLIDLDADLKFVPQLATAWSWSPDNMALTLTLRDGVRFQDGEPMDADAVRVNIERYRSAPESVRRGETRAISAVEVIDPHTIRLRLSQPYAPLTAVLADRVGMMMSPKALARLGKDISTAPVCAGPFKFTQRVAQDRIVLDRFGDYWDSARVSLDRIVYQPITDTTTRLVNLRSGQLDLIERMAPSDANTVRSDPHLRLISSPSIAYYGLFFNLNHGPQSDNPLGRDVRVRQAFEKALDRAAINQVVFDGQFVPNNQVEAPGTTFWDPGHPVPPRDLEGAKALLKQAGLEKVSATLIIPNAPIGQQLGEAVQSMVAEAGFDIKLQQMEANAAFAASVAGEYQVTTGIWSGRPDPDGNISIWVASDGFLNWGRYHNPTLDELLARARSVTDVPARQKLYRQVTDIYLHDLPFIVLYHQKWLFGLSDKVQGFQAVPDGMIRPQGIRLAN